MTVLGQMLRQDGLEEGLEKGLERGIKGMIMDYLDEGVSREKICAKLVKIFEITPEKAGEYFERFSNV